MFRIILSSLVLLSAGAALAAGSEAEEASVKVEYVAGKGGEAKTSSEGTLPDEQHAQPEATSAMLFAADSFYLADVSAGDESDPKER
ncbi:MAG: hypothetical protein ABR567_02660 [Myxococcales bacterium]|nr:hypothetical protein [Myxococcales bacterium]